MSKNRNKKAAVVEPQQPSEELIKSVFELYKPNKIQKFFMRWFSPLTTDFKVQRTTGWTLGTVLVLSILFGILGLRQSSVATGVVFAIGFLPTVAGIIYNIVTNNKRVKEIMNILKFTEKEVLGCERTYYLGY